MISQTYKCFTALPEVEDLRFIMNPSGVKAKPEEVQMVRDYPVPQNKKDVTALQRLTKNDKKIQRTVPGL